MMDVSLLWGWLLLIVSGMLTTSLISSRPMCKCKLQVIKILKKIHQDVRFTFCFVIFFWGAEGWGLPFYFSWRSLLSIFLCNKYNTHNLYTTMNHVLFSLITLILFLWVQLVMQCTYAIISLEEEVMTIMLVGASSRVISTPRGKKCMSICVRWKPVNVRKCDKMQV